MNKTTIKKALKTWADHCPTAEDRDHLDMARIYQLSRPNGMAHAEAYEMDHLSMCPMCMDKWAACAALSDFETADGYEAESGKTIMSCGFLEAAATEFKEPLFLKSSCRRFILGLLPELGEPAKGMAVLEAVSEKEQAFEGMEASVQDAGGIRILKGALRHGRAATRVDDLNSLDLSTWTVVLTRAEDTKGNG